MRITTLLVALFLAANATALAQSGWFVQSSNVPSPNDLFSVFFTDSNIGTAVGGWDFSSIIRRTTDGGRNWSSQEVNTYWLLSVFFTDNNTGTVVGCCGLIFRTTNGGASWSQQHGGTDVT